MNNFPIFFSFFGWLTISALAIQAQPGHLDSSFNPGTGVDDGPVFSVLVGKNEMIYLVGYFYTVNGLSRPGIARLFSNGTVDLTFAVALVGHFHRGLELADGRILVTGAFTGVNGYKRMHLARLHPDGRLDVTFDAGPILLNGSEISHVDAIAVQPDARIILSGSFDSVNGAPRKGVARLQPDGALDPTFNPGNGAPGHLPALTIQPDGKTLIGGNFSEFNSQPRYRLVRLNSNGSLDTSFSPKAGSAEKGSYLAAVVRQPDGRILVGGRFTQFNDAPRSGIARLNADGTLDDDFNPGAGLGGTGTLVVNAVALESDGKILIGGRFQTVQNEARNWIARLHPNGALDRTFDPGLGAQGPATAAIYTLVPQNDGTLWAAGDFRTFAGIASAGIVRLYTAALALDNYRLAKPNYLSFGVNIPFSLPTVIETSDDLAHWTAVQTNSAGPATLEFNQEILSSAPRFFRVRTQP